MKSKGSELGKPDMTKPQLTKGSVLDDLGFLPHEALEIKVKADLYRDLLRYIGQKGLSQQELGAVLGIHQPDVSNLLSGKVSKFSVGKLIKFAGKLELGARIRLTGMREPKSRVAVGMAERKRTAPVVSRSRVKAV